MVYHVDVVNRRWRVDLSYDGTNFHGWARQPGLRTVQGEVERALATVLRLPTTPQLTCAGRTDAGVHARGQVAHFDIEGDWDGTTIARRLQRVLDDDITIHHVQEAPPGFDARFSALERRYVYRISDNPNTRDPLLKDHITPWNRPLNVEAMRDAAQFLLGEHDFAAFCKKREGATTIRELKELMPARAGGTIATTVRADAFCHSMVRALIGGLVAVGEGRHKPEWIDEVLRTKQRNPHVRVMPAQGLTLEEVTYPPDDQLAKVAQQSRRRRDEPCVAD